MIETPYTEAVLAGTPYNTQRLERLAEGKQLLEEGLADKQIYNAEFQTAKERIRYALDDTFHALHNELLNVDHAKGFADVANYDYWDFDSSFNSASVAKGLRTLTKKFPTWSLGKQGSTPALAVIYRYMDVLNEAVQLVNLLKAVKSYVIKGRKPTVLTDAQRKQQEADLKNTGICPVCHRRQKLSMDGRMVAHGYVLDSKWGGRNGMCFGRGYEAWELSDEGAVAFVAYLQKRLESTERSLKQLQDSVPVELTETVRIRKGVGVYENEFRKHPKGTPAYEKLRQQGIWANESDIRSLNANIQTYSDLIANWKPEPLKYGGAETQERWKNRLLN